MKILKTLKQISIVLILVATTITTNAQVKLNASKLGLNMAWGTNKGFVREGTVTKVGNNTIFTETNDKQSGRSPLQFKLGDICFIEDMLHIEFEMTPNGLIHSWFNEDNVTSNYLTRSTWNTGYVNRTMRKNLGGERNSDYARETKFYHGTVAAFKMGWHKNGILLGANMRYLNLGLPTFYSLPGNYEKHSYTNTINGSLMAYTDASGGLRKFKGVYGLYLGYAAKLGDNDGGFTSVTTVGINRDLSFLNPNAKESINWWFDPRVQIKSNINLKTSVYLGEPETGYFVSAEYDIISGSLFNDKRKFSSNLFTIKAGVYLDWSKFEF
jgi:hypothetical protein